MILKKPVIFCDFYNLYSYNEFKNIIIVCKDSKTFVNNLFDAHKINDSYLKEIELFLEKHYFKTDGLSCVRTVDAIKELIIKNKLI